MAVELSRGTRRQRAGGLTDATLAATFQVKHGGRGLRRPRTARGVNSVTVSAYVVLPRYGTLTVLGVGELQQHRT